jgi:thymidylate kinase
MIISFSGLDGSGKSLQISLLRDYFEKKGYKTIVKSMYFDLTLFSFFRSIKYKIFGKKSNNEIKTVIELSKLNKVFKFKFLKFIFFIFDIFFIYLYLYLFKKINKNNSILFLDRYLYDEYVDLYNNNFKFIYEFLINLFFPVDYVVFMIVSPETSFKRKAEYNIEYLRFRFDFYPELFLSLPKKQFKILINTEYESQECTTAKLIRFIA